nr:zinc finger protein 84-like [Penaeus vannamei]
MSRKSQATPKAPSSAKCAAKCSANRVICSFTRMSTRGEALRMRPCGRRFSQKGNLLRHSLLHTNEKPFGCGVCRKFFVQKAHLVKHVVVHRQRLAALKRCRRREALERGSSAEAKEGALSCKCYMITSQQTVKGEGYKALNILQVLSYLSSGADCTALSQLYRVLIRSKLDNGCAFRSSPLEFLYAQSGESSL